MSFFRGNQAVVLGPGEGTHLDVLGDLITLLVSGKETNGAFTVLSQTSPPGGGTPLHTHHKEDEALYVLKGEYEIQCGDQTVRAGPGSFVFAPREIPQVASSCPAYARHSLDLALPQEECRFLRENASSSFPSVDTDSSFVAGRADEPS